MFIALLWAKGKWQMAKASPDVLKYPPITETTLKFHFAIILQLIIHYKLPFQILKYICGLKIGRQMPR